MDCCGHQKEMRPTGAQGGTPAAGAGLVVGSMAMIGIPFFSGFVSKISFAMASFHDLDRTVLVLRSPGCQHGLITMWYIHAHHHRVSKRLEKADYERQVWRDAALCLRQGEPVKDVSFAATMACLWLGDIADWDLLRPGGPDDRDFRACQLRVTGSRVYRRRT